MKTKILLCCLILAPAPFVQAQGAYPDPDSSPATKVTPAPFQQVLYFRDVPKAVRQTMPQGTKTLFWGRFTPTKNKFPVCVHLFELWQAEEDRIKNNYRREGDTIHCALDIFDGTNASHPKRINRVFLTTGYGQFAALYDVKFYWLNSQEQNQPMLVIENYGQGDYGPSGSDDYVVFGSGWLDRATDDTFSLWHGHASGVSGQENEVFYDSKGMARLRVITFPDTEMTEEQLNLHCRAIFKWQEGGFTLVSEEGEFLRDNISFSGWNRVPRPTKSTAR